MKRYVCDLTPEDLARWRENSVKMRALELNPWAYSKDETEVICRQSQHFWIEAWRTYDLDPKEVWNVDQHTGKIHYVDD